MSNNETVKMLEQVFDGDEEARIYLSGGYTAIGREIVDENGNVVEGDQDDVAPDHPRTWTVRRVHSEKKDGDGRYELEQQGSLKDCLGRVIAEGWSNNPIPDDGVPNAYADIIKERMAQDEQWGGPKHDDAHNRDEWYRYLGRQLAKIPPEHAGQTEGAREAYRKALVKLAAVAVAALEAHDRDEEARQTCADRQWVLSPDGLGGWLVSDLRRIAYEDYVPTPPQGPFRTTGEAADFVMSQEEQGAAKARESTTEAMQEAIVPCSSTEGPTQGVGEPQVPRGS